MSTLPEQTEPRLALFAPPYEQLVPIDVSWVPSSMPPRGEAIVWRLVDGKDQEAEFRWLHHRAPGLPLFLVLPPATELSRSLPLLHYVNVLDPRFVLPHGRMVAPHYLKQLLAAPPQHFAVTLTDYLTRRGLLIEPRIRNEVRRIFECVPETSSITQLSRRLYTSRRTLGRHFAAAGLPVPSHWLQFGRLLLATLQIQTDATAIFRIASRVGYPDGFTMSNQMKRLFGCRPTEVRDRLGWEWVVESWIRQEARAGNFDLFRYRDAVGIYRGDSASGRNSRHNLGRFPSSPPQGRIVADRRRRNEDDRY